MSRLELTADRPRVALTMGDVAGIGPEVVARVAGDADVRAGCRPLVVGHPGVLRRALDMVGSPLDVVERDAAGSDDQDDQDDQLLACWNPSGEDVADLAAGEVDRRAGRAAVDWLRAAASAAVVGDVAAVVTAPINKAALGVADIAFPGHTEILADVCGVNGVAMMLFLPPQSIDSVAPHGLGVAHVTLHSALAEVPAMITRDAVRSRIDLLHRFMRNTGCPAPRIGVCALNPHAGEGGLFGDEESRQIAPAVESAVDDRLDVVGPLPADALLRRAVGGEFDGVVAMYHDQGHIALKLVGFESAVNVTLGLPIIRTSPSHGTAFDIAWQGRADPRGMREAVVAAVRLVGGDLLSGCGGN